MKIAILGWGSLIWQPKTLAFDKEKEWKYNGPMLPIEFTRISNDGRLTLVIDNDAQKIQTFYAVSLYKELDEAVLDLAIREGGTRKSIGYYNQKTDKFKPESFNDDLKQNIRVWTKSKSFDAVIWTNLGRKFKDKIGLDYNSDNVIKYLKTLPENIKIIAEEYIRKAPKQIQTPIRKEIEEKLGWTHMPNPENRGIKKIIEP